MICRREISRLNYPNALAKLLLHLLPNATQPFWHCGDVEDLVRSLLRTSASRRNLLRIYNELAQVGCPNATALGQFCKESWAILAILVIPLAKMVLFYSFTPNIQARNLAHLFISTPRATVWSIFRLHFLTYCYLVSPQPTFRSKVAVTLPPAHGLLSPGVLTFATIED